MGNRITIAEVARAAGVSKTTVSVVLNGEADRLGIRQATRELVLGAARELGYTPNHAARMLRRGRTGVLAMLVQSLANPLFVDMAVAARRAAEAGGYELNVVDAGLLEAEVAALGHLRDDRADGVVVASGRHFARAPALAQLLELVGRGLPAVLLIDQSPDPTIPAIRADVYGGSYAAVAHLARLGHRRIAHAGLDTGGDLENEPSSQGDRYRAYRAALADAGIDYDPSWLVTGPDTLAGGRDMARRLLALDPRPTAVFVYNDLTAFGVLRALNEAGVRVPHDVAVVGFDGVELGGYVTPSLTTVALPAARMGELAVETLFGLMNGAPPAVLDQVLPAQLVVRESCGGA